jgi:PAS domain-containing protein/DNA-binding CsgD family transcriptional regulator
MSDQAGETPGPTRSDPERALEAIPLGVMVLDAGGRITYTNRAFRQTWGPALDLSAPVPGQLARYDIRDPQGHRLSLAELPPIKALAGSSADGIFYRLDGQLRIWTRATARPLLAEGGAVTGAVIVFADVTAEQEEHRITVAILEQIPTGVVVFDADGRVTLANRSAARIFGAVGLARPMDEILRDIPIVDAESGVPVAPGSDPVRRALRGETVKAYVVAVPTGTGQPQRRFSGSAVPLREPDGSVTGAIALVRDVTDEVERRREEQQSEARERLLASLTPRERVVLDGIAAGNSNHEIALRMGISYTTVRTHVRAVLTKLGARSRLEAAAMAGKQPTTG